MKQYEMFELVFPGKALTDSWAQIDLTAEFACGDTVRSVRGFYDGDGRYVVRFLPDQPGLWRWKVSGVLSAEGEAVPPRPALTGW